MWHQPKGLTALDRCIILGPVQDTLVNCAYMHWFNQFKERPHFSMDMQDNQPTPKNSLETLQPSPGMTARQIAEILVATGLVKDVTGKGRLEVSETSVSLFNQRRG